MHATDAFFEWINKKVLKELILGDNNPMQM